MSLWSVVLPFSFYPFGVFLAYIYFSTALPRTVRPRRPGLPRTRKRPGKIALQFAVATSPCVTTVIGRANAANVRRNAAWIGEPLDEDLLSDIDAILAPVRDQGWINGRPENQDPGRPS
jgi:hypothetical protein